MKYPHWYYFVALVEDLERTSRFVEICEENYAAYSIEYSQLILAACSEIDVVAKLICLRVDKACKADSINDYCKILLSKYTGLASIEVILPRYEVSFIPWEGWRVGESPKWWRCYNEIKHERDKYFRKASLENAIFSIGALAVMVSYLYHEELSGNKFNPVPGFIFIARKYSQGSIMHGQPMYYLPDFRKKSEEGSDS